MALPALGETDPLPALQGSLWYPRGLSTSLITPQSRAHPGAALSLPHLAADTRVALLGLGGGGVVGDGSVGGSIGLTVPSRRIVWTGAAGVAFDDLGGVSRGTLALARPLGSRLAAGASVSIHSAGTDDGVSIGAGVDVGARYRLGALGDFSRVEAHAALLNIGNAVSRGSYEGFIQPFTPVLGVRARVLDGPAVEMDAAATLRLERFQRPGAGGAVEFRFARGLNLALGVDLPLDGGDVPLWPGVNISFRIPTGDDRTDLSTAIQPTTAGAMLVAGDVVTSFPSSDTEPPVLTVEMVSPTRRPAQQYGGRNSSEGSARTSAAESVGLAPSSGQEQLVLNVLGDDNRAIHRLSAEMSAPNGEVLRRWRFEPVGEPVIQGDMASRLTSDLAHRSFGSTVVWGIEDAPRDGRYRLQVVATDAAGNETQSAELGVVVDSTPPDMAVELFRNGVEAVDGDEAPFQLDPDSPFSVRVRYDDADVVDVDVVDEAGRPVFRLDAVPDITGEQALEAEWSGQNTDGSPVRDGLYRFRARGEDRYGNGTTVFSPEILVRRRQPVFRIGIDRSIVSPVGSEPGIRATPELRPLPGLREWTIGLYRDEAEDETEPVRRWSGIDLPPAAIVLQGSDFPEDGRYFLSGFARYTNGGLVEEETPSFLVDRVPPEVNIGLSDIAVMPRDNRRLVVFVEGGGTAQSGRLMLRESPPRADAAAEPVVLRELDVLPDEIEWSLVLPDGRFLAPGLYEIWLEAEDSAGNVGRSPSRNFELVPRLEGAEISPQDRLFSPVGDRGGAGVTYALRGPADADRGEFSVTIESGAVSRRISGNLPLPESIRWDGRDDQGVPFPDGPVTAELTITVPDRGEIEATADPLIIDTTAPEVFLDRIGPEFVSPDGDGVQDRVILRGDYGDAVSGTLVVREESSGNVVRRITQPIRTQDSEQAITLELEPLAENGSVIPDGRYEIVAEATDAAGNRAVSDPVSFTVDTRPVGGFLRVSAGAISPNGDGVADSVAIEPIVPDVSGLQSWEFLVTPVGDGDDPVLRRGGFGPVLPERIEWPGEDSSVIDDGDYEVQLRGRYRHGPELNITSPVITVDATPPEVTVSVAPQPFSPDGDGRDDTVAFELSVDDSSSIEYWLLEVFEPTGEFFYDTGGRGNIPDRVVWDGTARNGERVVSAERYPWRLEIADELGNITVVEDELLVDVLVEPFEDGYRIQIPSITFPGNSADLILDPGDPRGRQNRQVLDRLVEILGRFPEYSITVEGHAVNLSGTEREEQEELVPLSRRRAEAVQAALIERGVAARLLSARGRGGRAPLVPHDDELNRWKNRRVDFVLQR
ncbi:MAG: OmpA family protein [Alkalispirochaeta sp.]